GAGIERVLRRIPYFHELIFCGGDRLLRPHPANIKECEALTDRVKRGAPEPPQQHGRVNRARVEPIAVVTAEEQAVSAGVGSAMTGPVQKYGAPPRTKVPQLSP